MSIFKKKNIITAVDLGTSKFRIAAAEVNPDNKISLLAYKEGNNNNSMKKGQVVSVEKAETAISVIIDEIESELGIVLADSHELCISVTGPNIKSTRKRALVKINNEDGRVSADDIHNAVNEARNDPEIHSDNIIASVDSLYVLDGRNHLREPIGHKAHTLEAEIIIFYFENKNRIETITGIFEELGFEDKRHQFVVSGLASMIGSCTPDEREDGILVLDLGQGTTEYVLVYKDGIRLCSSISVGLQHILNDLHVGLSIGMDKAKSILMDSRIDPAEETNDVFFKVKGALPGKSKKISINSARKIVELRCREIAEIIKEDIHRNKLMPNFPSGIKFCGGGAYFHPAERVFEEVLEHQCSKAEPLNIEGNFLLNKANQTVVRGVLNIAQSNMLQDKSSIRSPVDFLSGIFDSRLQKISKPIKESFKF